MAENQIVIRGCFGSRRPVEVGPNHQIARRAAIKRRNGRRRVLSAGQRQRADVGESSRTFEGILSAFQRLLRENHGQA